VVPAEEEDILLRNNYATETCPLVTKLNIHDTMYSVQDEIIVAS
jgi:hypothetical protein